MVDPTQYRPISLLSLMSKLLEKHIKNLILAHLDVDSVLSDRQWGFLQDRLTIGALLNTFDNRHRSLGSGHGVAAIFLDLAKAFYKVLHTLLLNKLEKLGFEAYLLRWLGNYLLDRSYVVVGGESSQISRVMSSVLRVQSLVLYSS